MDDVNFLPEAFKPEGVDFPPVDLALALETLTTDLVLDEVDLRPDFDPVSLLPAALEVDDFVLEVESLLLDLAAALPAADLAAFGVASLELLDLDFDKVDLPEADNVLFLPAAMDLAELSLPTALAFVNALLRVADLDFVAAFFAAAPFLAVLNAPTALAFVRALLRLADLAD